MTTYGYPLRAHDVPDEQRQALTAVRAIVAAGARPDVHLSVPGLAEATGLSPDVVVELLASDTYKVMLLGSCKQRCAGVFNKGITRLEEFVETSQDPEIVIKALGQAAQLYKVLSNDGSGHAHKQSRRDEEELIKQLTMLNRISDSTSTVEPTTVKSA